jgi:hypothetical protein
MEAKSNGGNGIAGLVFETFSGAKFELGDVPVEYRPSLGLAAFLTVDWAWRL